MIHTVVIFALALSAANWLLFPAVVVVSNAATIRLALGKRFRDATRLEPHLLTRANSL